VGCQRCAVRLLSGQRLLAEPCRTIVRRGPYTGQFEKLLVRPARLCSHGGQRQLPCALVSNKRYLPSPRRAMPPLRTLPDRPGNSVQRILHHSREFRLGYQPDGGATIDIRNPCPKIGRMRFLGRAPSAMLIPNSGMSWLADYARSGGNRVAAVRWALARLGPGLFSAA
jgi:hypothetical protein